VLGIVPTHRWPATDAAHEMSVRAGLATALRNGATTEERTAALVSLLHALKVAHKVVDPGSVGLSKKELNANAKRIAERDWAAKAVRQAIDNRNAAIIAADDLWSRVCRHTWWPPTHQVAPDVGVKVEPGPPRSTRCVTCSGQLATRSRPARMVGCGPGARRTGWEPAKTWPAAGAPSLVTGPSKRC
jgi:Golgi phosphoprotein 3 (GPP34)